MKKVRKSIKSKNPPIIFTAGGTGGHLFPAQAAAFELQGKADILFVAAGLAENRFFDRETFSFKEVSSSSLTLRHPLKALRGAMLLLKGILQSLRVIKEFRPVVIVGFGSFFSFPMLAAAWLKRIPIVLHEQNAIPGKVNRLFSPLAVATAVTFPSSKGYLKGKTVPVQFPLRAFSQKDPTNPWSYFKLKEGVRTFLVFGGSQGAHKLNSLFLEASTLLSFPFQVIHFTGKQGNLEMVQEHYSKQGISACVKEFETRMDLAFQISDIAISRAGASTIAELIATETPAVLIPFPFATENHQEKNGHYFTTEVGGGLLLIEKEASGRKLAEAISQLVEKELKERKKKIQSHKTQQKLQTLAELIDHVGGNHEK